MSLPALWSETFWLACAVAALGGFFRGFSGFGGVMAMTPLFSLLMPAPVAAVLSIVIDAVAAIPLMPNAVRVAQKRSSVIMAIAASLTVVAGVWLLVSVDGDIMRRVIAATVILAALLLLSPWRYKGPQTDLSDAAVGAASGFLAGSTSMAGPPCILYLTALGLPAATTRATFIFYSMLMTGSALVFFVWFQVLSWQVLFFALALAPANFAAVYLGQRLFRIINDEGFRRFTLVFLIGLGVVVLVTG